MKKLMLLMSILIVTCFAFNGIVAFADEESVGEDSVVESVESVEESVEEVTEESVEESVVESVEETTILTKEEIKDIVDSALNEQQKNIVAKVADSIAQKFGLDGVWTYIVIGAIVASVLFLIFLFGKLISISRSNASMKEKLKATSALYDEMTSKYNETLDAVKKGDAEKTKTIVSEYVAPKIAEVSEQVTNDVVNKLKFDSETQAKLLGGMMTTTKQLSQLTDALRVLAIKSKNTELANALSEHITDADYARVCLENQKLKVALGETKVSEVLADEKKTD